MDYTMGHNLDIPDFFINNNWMLLDKVAGESEL